MFGDIRRWLQERKNQTLAIDEFVKERFSLRNVGENLMGNQLGGGDKWQRCRRKKFKIYARKSRLLIRK